jgi:hypothetical protein
MTPENWNHANITYKMRFFYLNNLNNSYQNFIYYAQPKRHRYLIQVPRASQNIRLPKIEFAQIEYLDLQIWNFDCKVTRFAILNTSNSTSTYLTWYQYYVIDISTRNPQKFESGQTEVYSIFGGFYKMQICWKRINRVPKKKHLRANLTQT